MNELLAWIDNYKKSNPTGWRKWIVGFFVMLVSVIAAAAWAIVATARGNQIAGLQTQRDVAQEAVQQAVANQQLATDAQAQQQHAQAAAVARQQVQQIQEQLQNLQDQHERNTSIISGITSWSDVDNKVK